MNHHPIGVFDSGFGGLTVLKEIERVLPDHDLLYFGDNARAPYGNRSFEIVHAYTLEAVERLFAAGCHLVVLACNTASAKALRTIQQNDLPRVAPERRVLGVIRPVTEWVGTLSRSGHVGILATAGTVASGSYEIEIRKSFPGVTVTQEACPMWVPLIENGEFDTPGADCFIERHVGRLMEADPLIDVVVLGCTHYPLIQGKIEKLLPPGVRVVAQGGVVADRLADYLRRHPEIAAHCSRRGVREFLTSESPEAFDRAASLFYGKPIRSRRQSDLA
ncbi:MAG: glutamate racemase [Acidobacteriota bacterium]|jgi:glutamate racemase|nr:glutamate racemase [Acidobacteriota bacterium]